MKKPRKEKKKGQRKNIRKIIGDDKLDAKTLQARQEEIERAKKAEERSVRSERLYLELEKEF